MQNFINIFLEENSVKFKNVVAIKSKDFDITYQELHSKVNEIVQCLKSHNVTQSLSIVLRFQNQTLLLLVSLALFKIGSRQIIINPFDLLSLQLDKLNECDADLVIQDISLDHYLIEDSIFIDLDLNVQKRKEVLSKIDQNLFNGIAIVFLSSGTTGKSKVVELPSNVFLATLENDLNVCPFNSCEIFYSYSKLYYQFTLRRILVALKKGLTVLLPNYNSHDLIKFCIVHSVQHLILTADQTRNFLLKNIKNYKKSYPLLPKLKSCTLSSSLINEALRSNVRNYISKNIYISYGTNEFGNISEATPKDILSNNSNVGKINPNVKIQIVDDTGEKCDNNIVGHVKVQTTSMITEYYKNTTDTIKSFRDGWFYPGDLGKLTEDSKLIIEGRSDDMMIFSGVNMYPRELESILDEHPNVVESAVFPLKINGQDGIPFAFVILNKSIEEKELLNYCEKKSGWKRPQRIFTIDKFPRNPTGKVLKKELIQLSIERLKANQIKIS